VAEGFTGEVLNRPLRGSMVGADRVAEGFTGEVLNRPLRGFDGGRRSGGRRLHQ